MNKMEKIALASRLNILDVMSAFGIKLSYKGHRTVCPFCGGENPTKFSISEKGNCFYCFCCGSGGGPIQFASAYLFGSTDNSLAFSAAEYLNELFGIWTPEEDLPEKQKKILKEIEEKRRIEAQKEVRRKRIVEKEEALYKLHKKNEHYFAAAFKDESIPADTIFERIVFDCMVKQKQEYLLEKIMREKLLK